MSLMFIGLLVTTAVGAPDDRPCVLTVVGAAGGPEHAAEFRRTAELWKAAAARAGAGSISIGLDDEGEVADREKLRLKLNELSKTKGAPLWVVLIGHGTYDGHDAKFNLRGPDVTDRRLGEWLAPIERPLAVLDCSSSSAPFLNRLSGAGRTIVTATKSGHESNRARFGRFLAESIADPRADLDKDGQVSLLEAFLTASARVEEHYKARSRLATEHALIDDNGDGLGTPAEWFEGVRATRPARDGARPDGTRAHQLHLIMSDREKSIPPAVRRRRDAIELEIAALREQKPRIDEDAYYRKLEPLMLELGRLYRDAKTGADAAGTRP